ncbi:MAG: isoprenyl transferase [Rhodospirillaceae bacterium]|nr:isoprenyl transferase [Rhodospirillaceae bacterium]MBT5245454.1 isoprenyl transferase [Rhodospirillaceae bacterium]MBT5562610.1 isoprenyl transferase [Rhodospirillaceae bacterium]MBT6242532.1 isoprenyl transferase [Rhodospirillaceae bacterium]MBT7136584.1 isoprenyl transferase [Rhodospirillaceae bacterium]
MKAVPVDRGNQASPPVHVAIIMDGNGRWAKNRNLPKVAGHKRGAAAVKTAIKSAIEAGVSYLTLYGFSSENWKRPSSEVKDLMGLLRFYLKSEISILHKEGVRFCVIGDRKRLDDDIVKLIDDAEKLTAANTRLILSIALSYGGRAEITEAARKLAERAKAGEIDVQDIDEDIFASSLYTGDIPDPDILIRTSGEQRISNFLLWQLAYAEFVFLDVLWPDFSKQDFDQAILSFHGRNRRYGATSE